MSTRVGCLGAALPDGLRAEPPSDGVADDPDRRRLGARMVGVVVFDRARRAQRRESCSGGFLSGRPVRAATRSKTVTTLGVPWLPAKENPVQGSTIHVTGAARHAQAVFGNDAEPRVTVRQEA